MTSNVLCVVVLAGTTIACGSPKKSTTADGPEQVTLRKLDAYLQCHLQSSEAVFHAEDLYRLDFADGPPGPNRVVVLPVTPDPATCFDGIAAAAVLPPSLPELEAAGVAYARELARVHRLTSTYDRAKPTEFHAELMSAFDAFDRAQAALYDQVYAVNRKTHLAQLARRDYKEGSIDLIVERTQLAAEDVVRFAAVPWNQLDGLDTVAFASSIAGLELEIASLNELDQEEEQAENFELHRFRDDVGALVTAARQLARRAHDHLQYTDAETLMIRAGNETSVVGSPAAMADAYNRVAELRAYDRVTEPR